MDAEKVPMLFAKMAAILESAGEKLGWTSGLPAAEVLKESITKALREHAQELQHAGGEAGRVLVHVMAGMIIGDAAAGRLVLGKGTRAADDG